MFSKIRLITIAATNYSTHIRPPPPRTAATSKISHDKQAEKNEIAKHADAYDYCSTYTYTMNCACRNHLITFTWPHSMTSRVNLNQNSFLFSLAEKNGFVLIK